MAKLWGRPSASDNVAFVAELLRADGADTLLRALEMVGAGGVRVAAVRGRADGVRGGAAGAVAEEGGGRGEGSGDEVR